MPLLSSLFNKLMEQRLVFITVIVEQRKYIKELEEELKQLKNLKNNING